MRMTGAQMVCEALVAEGVKDVFGLPGGAIMPLYDVLPQYPIRHVLVRHEQGAAHMADGYGRATNNVGVCMATSGPGAINLVVGLATAQMDSAPVVAITANVATSVIGSDAFQEADITGITIPVTKQNFLVRHPKDLPRVLREAFHLARSGRPGAVLVDIPKDVLTGEAEFRYPETVDLPGYNPTLRGNMVQIRKAARLIEHAQRPVIIAGHGILIAQACDELRELAERMTIPVANTLLGISNFPTAHPLFLGMLGMHGTATACYAVDQSDLVIGIGIRFDDRAMGKFSAFAPRAKIIHIDIDPAEIGKNVRTDVPIVGDAKRVLQALLQELKEPVDRTPWLNQIREWQRLYPLPSSEKVPGELTTPDVIRAVYEATDGDCSVVTDVGQHQMFVAQRFPFRRANTHFSSGGLGTMGFALPAAIGVQFARPDETVWCFSGDGGFQMVMQELAVVAAERLPLKIALVNNCHLGMVRQWQELFYRGNYVAVDLAPGTPNFQKIAEAYGIATWRVTERAEALPAVRAAMAHPGPALIEFMVRPDENVFPMVVPGTSLAEVIVNEAHAGRHDGKPAGGVQSRPEPVPVPGLRG
ncbi:MAG: biosynthetic-type acetolactate synthase large subunit [Chloroflexi bacterium]|nr:biosynthetic-type acetolactate synthase large subunit [Chloroflexota bacterium]